MILLSIILIFLLDVLSFLECLVVLLKVFINLFLGVLAVIFSVILLFILLVIILCFIVIRVFWIFKVMLFLLLMVKWKFWELNCLDNVFFNVICIFCLE